jgi:hypothetical protein
MTPIETVLLYMDRMIKKLQVYADDKPVYDILAAMKAK